MLGKKAKNDVYKQLTKMMNNSIFWKTLENKRKYRDIKTTTKKQKHKKEKKQETWCLHQIIIVESFS